jgi:hypothetical protein
MKEAVTHNLNDPESARFRNLQVITLEGTILERLNNSPKHWNYDWFVSTFTYDPECLDLCGEVNAKNHFGAYVGYRPFFVGGDQNPKAFIDTGDGDNFARDLCNILPSVIYSVP